MKNLLKYTKNVENVVRELSRFNLDTLDLDYKELKKAFHIAYLSGIFNLTDIEKNHLDLYKYELFKHLTQVSGALSFMAIQILAANAIMQGNNFRYKEKYFKRKCGIAINHLRAPITLVSAQKVDGGYSLKGTLTWASGYKIFDTLLIGFHCDGSEYEVVTKFKKQNGFTIDKPTKTFVGNSLHTVNIELDNFFVKEKNIISSKPMGNYSKAKSISRTVHLCLYALGNSALLQTKDEEFKKKAKDKLDALKDPFLKSTDSKKMDLIRVELFELVLNIITTAIILQGGKSILSSGNLQRLYRELIMFNANGLNHDLKEISKTHFLR